MGNEHSGGWPAVAIELTPDERTTLEAIAQQRTASYQAVVRARALLHAAEGERNRHIASRLGVDEHTVRTWRKEFVQRRLEALHDRKRPGRPRQFSPTVRAALTHLCCQKPGTEVGLGTEGPPADRPAPPARSPCPEPLPIAAAVAVAPEGTPASPTGAEAQEATPPSRAAFDPSPGNRGRGSDRARGAALFPPEARRAPPRGVHADRADEGRPAVSSPRPLHA
jgi:transposase-like protein